MTLDMSFNLRNTLVHTVMKDDASSASLLGLSKVQMHFRDDVRTQ